MKLLPKVLLGSSEELEYLDQCRQLLSLALVHPAFPHEDREALTYWLARLDEKSRGIMERTPGPSSQHPPPLPPRGRRIHQTEDQGRLNNGPGRIYINGCLDRMLPTQLEGSLEHLDSSSLELEEEEHRARTNSLGPGQGLYGGPEPPQLPPRPPPSTLDDYSSCRMFPQGSKSNSLPIPRTASGGSLLLDELGVQAAAIEWAAGMKGKG